MSLRETEGLLTGDEVLSLEGFRKSSLLVSAVGWDVLGHLRGAPLRVKDFRLIGLVNLTYHFVAS